MGGGHPLLLVCSNPAICNHKANKDTFDDYGVASCYNILPIRGGATPPPGVDPHQAAEEARGTEHFLDELLPEC